MPVEPYKRCENFIECPHCAFVVTKSLHRYRENQQHLCPRCEGPIIVRHIDIVYHVGKPTPAPPTKH